MMPFQEGIYHSQVLDLKTNINEKQLGKEDSINIHIWMDDHEYKATTDEEFLAKSEDKTVSLWSTIYSPYFLPEDILPC